MTHPSLAFVMMGVYSRDEQERQAALAELATLEIQETDSDSSSPILARQAPPGGHRQTAQPQPHHAPDAAA
eukprot:3310333-Amphidinium_carterae.1